MTYSYSFSPWLWKYRKTYLFRKTSLHDNYYGTYCFHCIWVSIRLISPKLSDARFGWRLLVSFRPQGGVVWKGYISKCFVRWVVAEAVLDECRKNPLGTFFKISVVFFYCFFFLYTVKTWLKKSFLASYMFMYMVFINDWISCCLSRSRAKRAGAIRAVLNKPSL